MWTIARTALTANRRRLLGMCSAVLMGVAFLSGTLVLGDTIRAGFDEAFTSANAQTDVVVRSEEHVGDFEGSTRPPLPVTLLDTVGSVEGVARAAGVIEGNAQIVGSDGTAIGGQGPPTFGTSWVDDPDLNPYTVAEGRAPAQDDEVVVDRGSARLGDLHVGDEITVRAPQPVTVRLVGLVAFGDEDSIGGTSLVGFTEERARELLVGGSPVFSSIGVVAADGVDADELQARLDAALPDGTEAITGAALTDELIESIGDDFLNFFTAFLVVFSGIALLVATFSIHNTFTVVLAQRTRESALLRAIGATRSQVLGGLAVEALVIGVTAAALGVAAGIGLAAGLDALFGAVGFDFPGDGLVIQFDSLLIAGAAGLAVTLLAALVPAVRASKTAPLAALRDVARDSSGTSLVRATLGATLLVGGLLTAALGSSSFALVGLGSVLAIFGAVVFGPVLVVPATTVLGALPARLRGGSGALARGNAIRNPRRTAGTATALVIGVCVVSMFTVFAASLKSSVTDTIAGSLTSDLVIQSDGFSGAGLSPELPAALDELHEVGDAVSIGDSPALLDGEEQLLSVSPAAALGRLTDLEVRDGALDSVGSDGMAVSAGLADDQGWSVGTVVEVTLIDGAVVPVRVAAVYERSEIVGSVVVPPELVELHTTQVMQWLVLISGAPGVGVDELRDAVTPVAEQHGVAEVFDLDEFAASSAAELDGFLAVVYALLALSIVIALVGIGNTLSLSIHERTRELGLLRAIGQTRRQLRSMVRWESVMVSTFGTATGLLLGSFIAWALMRALIEQEGIGTFTAPVVQLAVIVLIGGVVGVLAAARPARRAARMDVLDAIAAE